MQKPDIEKNIFLYLAKMESATINQIALKIKCEKEDLTNVIQNNTKNTSNPLGFILEDNKTSRIAILLNRQTMTQYTRKSIIILKELMES